MWYIDIRRKFLILLFFICVMIIYGVFSKKNHTNDNCYIENIRTDVPTFDPNKITDNVSWRVAMDIYEGLVGYDQRGQIKMLGAEKYEVSADGKIYTFYLRKNAKWSNGDSVTAEDYVLSLRRALDPKTLGDYFEQLLLIENAEEVKNGVLNSEELGVRAINDYILEIKIKNPSREFIHYLTLWIAAPIYRESFKKYGEEWSSKIENIFCNGAYKIVKYIQNGYVLLKKNEFYWNKENVKIENVKFLMLSDPTADLNKFRTGGEHVTYFCLPVNTKEWYVKNYGNCYKRYDILAQNKLSFNLNKKKFKDVRVRKALSMTVDRERLATDILKNGIPSYSPILECMENGFFRNIIEEVEDYNWVKWPFEKRVVLAKQLLGEAGYSKDNPLIFQAAFPTGPKKIAAESIQSTWNEVFDGMVHCNLLFEDWKIFLINQRNGVYELCHSDWVADYNLPSSFSMLYTTENNCNFTNFSNENVDRLYKESLSENNMSDYLEKQKMLAKIIMKNYVSIPYCGVQYTRLVSKKIGGVNFEHNNLDRFSTKDLFFKK